MTVVVPEDAPHLGGYVAGGDEATAFPHLWTWLAKDLRVGSVLDVGCGDGVALRAFRSRGIAAYGVDGVEQDDPDIVQHDYTRGPLYLADDGTEVASLAAAADFSLVWACEFVEHVEAEYVPNFLETFRQARLVLMTHAFPGQDGHHHVNCQPAEYWVGALAAVGYRFDAATTQITRALAGANPSPWNHYARSGLAFRRNA